MQHDQARDRAVVLDVSLGRGGPHPPASCTVPSTPVAAGDAPDDGRPQARPMPLPDLALALAAEQHWVLSRHQLLAAGVSRETLRWRIGRDWRLVLPGVYALQTGLPSQEQRLVAAQLVAGEDSWLAGTTAAALHGLKSCSLALPIRLLVPRPQRSRRVAWVDIGATSLLGEPVVERGPLRLGCLPRSVVDAAAQVPEERRARALMIEAVQRRLVR